MKIRLIHILFISLLINLASGLTSASEKTGNLIKLNSFRDWEDSQLIGAQIDPENPNRVILKKEKNSYLTEGVFISPIIEIESFTRVVPTWNILTPPGTFVFISLQVRVNENWSKWYPMGEWGIFYRSRSIRKVEDEFIYPSTDLIVLRNNQMGDAIRFKVELFGDGLNTPTIMQLTASIDVKTTISSLVDVDFEKELEIKPRSQRIEDPAVAGFICSPVALAMVLEYYGISKTNREVYELVYDYRSRQYGNWPFHAALAGSFGLEAYIDYYSNIDEIKKRIEEGIPVIVSIKIDEGELDGSPIDSIDSHVVVIRGFVNRDGQEYVITNDPAGFSNEDARIEYKIEQFIKAWSGWVLIVKGRNW